MNIQTRLHIPQDNLLESFGDDDFQSIPEESATIEESGHSLDPYLPKTPKDTYIYNTPKFCMVQSQPVVYDNDIDTACVNGNSGDASANGANRTNSSSNKSSKVINKNITNTAYDMENDPLFGYQNDCNSLEKTKTAQAPSLFQAIYCLKKKKIDQDCTRYYAYHHYEGSQICTVKAIDYNQKSSRLENQDNNKKKQDTYEVDDLTDDFEKLLLDTHKMNEPFKRKPVPREINLLTGLSSTRSSKQTSAFTTTASNTTTRRNTNTNDSPRKGIHSTRASTSYSDKSTDTTSRSCGSQVNNKKKVMLKTFNVQSNTNKENKSPYYQTFPYSSDSSFENEVAKWGTSFNSTQAKSSKNPNLHTAFRSERRHEFQNFLEEKKLQQAMKKDLERHTNEKYLIEKLKAQREAMVHKPRAIPTLKPVNIKPSTKPVTIPQGPKLGKERIFASQ